MLSVIIQKTLQFEEFWSVDNFRKFPKKSQKRFGGRHCTRNNTFGEISALAMALYGWLAG